MTKRKNRARRVDFSTYRPIYNRGFNPAYMEQLQDSLIARNYAEPQRVAFLSSALHESGGDPRAIDKTKQFQGLYQWALDRFPNTWDLGEQIHYALESAESKDTKKSWTHGGSGIPKINNALEGREAFWNSTDPYEATLYFNKGFVRPAEEDARINRAEEAANMYRNLFDNGGYVYDPNYGLSSLNNTPLLGGMSAARIGQPIFDYNLEKISNVPIIDITDNSNISNYFKDPTSIASPTYRTPNTPLPDKIDVKVGGKSLAEGPLTNQELGIKPKIDWNKGISIASAAMPVVGAAINPKGNTTTAGNIMQGIGGVVSMINPVAGLAIQGAGMLANAAFGSNIDQSKVSSYEQMAEQQAATTFGGGTNEALLAQYQAINPLEKITKDDIGSEGWFSNEATNTAKDINTQIENANNRMRSNFNLAVDNLAAYNSMLAAANYAKDGGRIYIKPSKRGTFTRAAKSRGLGVQEFASKVLANPEEYSETMRKKAQFAKNSTKWKHEDGGPLFNEFSNGVTLINEGGSHSENPYEGVPMGLDYEGIPNLVEEGEVLFNDYVFSNRLIVPDKVRTKYKLRNTKDLSFADAAKDIQKMSEEMPNDPIVKRTMETRLNDLINEQEMVRAKKNKRNKGNRYDWGSYLQYAPVALSSALALKDAFSGYDVDYSLFNPYRQAINNANVRVGTKPVTTNIEYKPFDTRTPLNELAASKAATTRALMNTSGGNPVIARALLTNADYNYNNQLGQLWRSAEEAEYNRRLGFEQFRTGLEANNRARELQAASTNAEILRSQAGLWGDYTNRLYNAERAQEAAYSSNLSSAITDLSNLGRQQDYASWIDKLQKAGIITDDEGKMALKLGANGGKIKRRRRLS